MHRTGQYLIHFKPLFLSKPLKLSKTSVILYFLGGGAIKKRELVLNGFSFDKHYSV